MFYVLSYCAYVWCTPFGKWSVINFKSAKFIEQSISCVTARWGWTASVCGQWTAHHSTLLPCVYHSTSTTCAELHAYLMCALCYYPKSIFAHRPIERIPFGTDNRKKIFAPVNHKSCMRPISDHSAKWRHTKPFGGPILIRSIYFYFATSREMNFPIITKNI